MQSELREQAARGATAWLRTRLTSAVSPGLAAGHTTALIAASASFSAVESSVAAPLMSGNEQRLSGTVKLRSCVIEVCGHRGIGGRGRGIPNASARASEEPSATRA